MKGRADSPSRLHDARSEQWAVLEGPLLPSVLARQGRRAEAVVLGRSRRLHIRFIRAGFVEFEGGPMAFRDHIQ